MPLGRACPLQLTTQGAQATFWGCFLFTGESECTAVLPMFLIRLEQGSTGEKKNNTENNHGRW